MSSTVINTEYTKPVSCIKDSQDFIKEYESMTLEEQSELIERTMKEWIEAFLGPNYKTMLQHSVY